MWRAILLATSLSACATTVLPPAALPISSSNQCAAPDGASVRYNSVYVAIGKRPNTGFGVELVSQLKKGNIYQFTVREVTPVAGRMYGQMQTHPCLIIVMPNTWQEAWVVNQSTGQQWRVRPSDDSGKQP